MLCCDDLLIITVVSSLFFSVFNNVLYQQHSISRRRSLIRVKVIKAGEAVPGIIPGTRY